MHVQLDVAKHVAVSYSMMIGTHFSADLLILVHTMEEKIKKKGNSNPASIAWTWALWTTGLRYSTTELYTGAQNKAERAHPVAV